MEKYAEFHTDNGSMIVKLLVWRITVASMSVDLMRWGCFQEGFGGKSGNLPGPLEVPLSDVRRPTRRKTYADIIAVP